MKCRNIELIDLGKEILARGNYLRFRAQGESMHPFIRDGDILEITPVNGEEIRLGDVIFYRVEGKHMVAHRVLKKITQNDKPVFVAKGDSSTGKEERVHLEQILGRVRAIERSKRRIRINHGLNKLMYVFYVRISPFLIKVRRIGGSLVRCIQGFKAYRNLAKRLIRGEILYQWESSEDSTKSLLAKTNNKIIGKTTIILKTNSPYHEWWIFGTWVNWRYRRLGVGSRLTEMLCEFARKQGDSEVKLLVFKDNKPALNLYQKLGFYQISIPQIDEKLTEEAKKTRRQRIIMKKDLLSSGVIRRSGGSGLDF